MTYPCFALKTLLVEKGIVYELYDSQDEIPLNVLNEGVSMYFEAYQHPRLHDGFSLETLQVDKASYSSYDEFISDMFRRDFNSYRFSNTTPRFYLQARRAQDGKIVGVCAILNQAPGTYYIEHIGVHKDFRRQKIALTLTTQFIKNIGEFHQISLDTRVFNQPAQSLYENLGFIKLTTHPLSSKQFTYFHYVLAGRPPLPSLCNSSRASETNKKRQLLDFVQSLQLKNGSLLISARELFLTMLDFKNLPGEWIRSPSS
jgi:ribosomal protein S18 acetylase RimI-like enzyme